MPDDDKTVHVDAKVSLDDLSVDKDGRIVIKSASLKESVETLLKSKDDEGFLIFIKNAGCSCPGT